MSTARDAEYGAGISWQARLPAAPGTEEEQARLYRIIFDAAEHFGIAGVRPWCLHSYPTSRERISHSGREHVRIGASRRVPEARSGRTNRAIRELVKTNSTMRDSLKFMTLSFLAAGLLSAAAVPAIVEMRMPFFFGSMVLQSDTAIPVCGCGEPV